MVLFGYPCLDISDKSVQHVEIGALEYVEFEVVVHWCDPARIDTEEESKLLGEVRLLDVSARLCRHPKLLRIRSRLEIVEAE